MCFNELREPTDFIQNLANVRITCFFCNDRVRCVGYFALVLFLFGCCCFSFSCIFFSSVCLKFIKLPPLQALSLDYFLRGFSSYHTREWIAIILIAFKFLDLKALCVAVSRFVCACAHLLATTVSFSYFVQHIPLSTVRVLFQYKLTHTHSNSAHERAIRFFRRSIFFPSLNSLGLSVLI